MSCKICGKRHTLKAQGACWQKHGDKCFRCGIRFGLKCACCKRIHGEQSKNPAVCVSCQNEIVMAG